MVEKQTEMSLDEVLSSIKQMVVDKDPPVLELTDMISSDGSIVKVKNGQKDVKGSSELKDFLRLAQENGKESLILKDSSPKKLQSANTECHPCSVEPEKGSGLPRHAANENPMASEGARITVNEIIREVATPLVKDWLEKNLPSLAKEVVTAEIQKMIKQN